MNPKGTLTKVWDKDMDKLQESLHRISQLLDERMDEILPKVDERKESRLIDAMRYVTLSEGKRLRPFLTVMSASLFGVSQTSSLQAAAAIEFVHAYSLVHDDLPAMDDDDMRRGQPSCHKKYDEATAILTGDALLTLAFEVLADEDTHADPKVRCELVRCLAQASGCRGMVGGQMLDLMAEDVDLNVNEIIRLQRMKTGAMFVISCEAGAILGKAAPNLRSALKGYAHDLGLAFQIRDDLLDAEGKQTKHGKEARKAKHLEKASIVGPLGFEKAKDQAAMLANQAIRHLDPFKERAEMLIEIARFVIERDR